MHQVILGCMAACLKATRLGPVGNDLGKVRTVHGSVEDGAVFGRLHALLFDNDRFVPGDTIGTVASDPGIDPGVVLLAPQVRIHLHKIKASRIEFKL